MMTDFYKEPRELESDLSDISDVKPGDLDKILKSAGELDSELFGIPKKKTMFKNKKKKDKDPDDPLADFSFSSDEEPIPYPKKLDKPPIDYGNIETSRKLASLMGHNERVDIDETTKTEKSSKSTSDWLGLKDSPGKPTAANPSILASPQKQFNLEEYTLSKVRKAPTSKNPKFTTVQEKKISPDEMNAKEKFLQSVNKVLPPDVKIHSRKKTHKKSAMSKLVTPPPPSHDDDWPITKPGLTLFQPKPQHLGAKIPVTSGARPRRNLLDELFGPNRSLDSVEERDIRPNVDGKEEEKSTKGGGSLLAPTGDGTDKMNEERRLGSGGYLPSASSVRRLDRRTDSNSAGHIKSTGFSGDYDWLLGTVQKDTEKLPVPQKTEIGTSQSLKTESLPPKETIQQTISKEGDKVPDWLGGIGGDDTGRKLDNVPTPSQRATGKSSSGGVKLPDWLGGSGEQPVSASTPVIHQGVDQHQPNLPPSSHPVTDQPAVAASEEPGSNIVSQLANVQNELGAAFTRHNQNLQIYMQVLMNEAQRMIKTAPPKLNMDFIKDEPQVQTEDKNESKKEDKIDKKSELIKNQEDLIHDLQISVNRLEIQNTHLEMKLENLKSTYEMEIESLKKTHGFELASWEARVERLKMSFDEIMSEYEEKILKFKANEEQLIEQHTERIEKLQKERLADLEKLGEFHRIALEQAASITIPAPNTRPGVRLPLKFSQRPKDDVELSERESALLEKERQIEVLKAGLEAEKRELDEALEIEKIGREEREREARRTGTEIRLRGEAKEREFRRQQEQLEMTAERIKIMRDEALKEQGNIVREKLELAAERARLDVSYSLQSTAEGVHAPPLDIIQARTELEAALETAREAKERAEQERRRQVEMRQAVEQISWEQKELDLRLGSREKHVSIMLQNAEKIRDEGLSALEEAKAMKQELDSQQRDIKEHLKQLENKEKVLIKERLEIAREKIEVEKRKSQLEMMLPELSADELLTLNPPSTRTYVDPKAVIMRLNAEKDFDTRISRQ